MLMENWKSEISCYKKKKLNLHVPQAKRDKTRIKKDVSSLDFVTLSNISRKLQRNLAVKQGGDM